MNINKNNQEAVSPSKTFQYRFPLITYISYLYLFYYISQLKTSEVVT